MLFGITLSKSQISYFLQIMSKIPSEMVEAPRYTLLKLLTLLTLLTLLIWLQIMMMNHF